MDTYEYPHSDFIRDFDPTLPSPNAAQQDRVQHLLKIRDYMRNRYSNETDQVERGAALGVVFGFLSRHMHEFDSGKIAVRGADFSLLSDHLLRALHTLVCSAALSGKAQPLAADVRALAEKLAHEEGGQ